MFGNEVEGPAASLLDALRWPQRLKEFPARSLTHAVQELPLVREPLVHRGCGCFRRSCHRSHCQALLALLAPQTVSGIHDAAFQSCICFPGHGSSENRPAIAANYILYSVTETMYKLCGPPNQAFSAVKSF